MERDEIKLIPQEQFDPKVHVILPKGSWNRMRAVNTHLGVGVAALLGLCVFLLVSKVNMGRLLDQAEAKLQSRDNALDSGFRRLHNEPDAVIRFNQIWNEEYERDSTLAGNTIDSICFEKLFVMAESGKLSAHEGAQLLDLGTFSCESSERHAMSDRLLAAFLKGFQYDTANGPDHAAYTYASIAHFRGALLWSHCFSYRPWHRQWDEAFAKEERRFKKALDYWAKHGTVTPNR